VIKRTCLKSSHLFTSLKWPFFSRFCFRVFFTKSFGFFRNSGQWKIILSRDKILKNYSGTEIISRRRAVALRRAFETLWPTTKPRSAQFAAAVLSVKCKASLHSLFRFQAKSVKERRGKRKGEKETACCALTRSDSRHLSLNGHLFRVRWLMF